ncbi:hypothetical protein BgAZ_108920 [Babesia gibsoni]|uniref:Lipoyl-binding domain-containing protein n=1 Tax=Babesia gibsoni TaxID=33632 RepID=A0AAD8UU20_BABGI|nr:hypothetical protein BgAZ_108920 [Babesia gibsoni]
MLGTARRIQWQSPPAVATASLDIGFSKLKSPYVGILQLRHFQSQSHAELKDALQPAPQNVDRLQTPLDTGTLFVVKVPTLAKNINHGKIHEWHKSVGDHVEAGDLLCVIETEQVARSKQVVT